MRATTPTTGINIQTCGDCHLLGFGGYATPELKEGRIKATEEQ